MTKPLAGRDWTAHAQFFEYTQAADPPVPAVPYDVFPAARHAHGPSAVLPWDLSAALRCPWPATSPGLLANFVRLLPGEALRTSPRASSQIFYVVSGSGRSRIDQEDLNWQAGDLFTLSAPGSAEHTASQESVLYWVHDEPLLRYLGASPSEARFTPTLYTRQRLLAEVAKVRAQPGAQRRNRMGVIMGNSDTPQTMTVTHTMWSLLNVLPPAAVQKPHRHNSVALDLCISAPAGVYTLISREISADGSLVNPQRADWSAGSAFVTPPGWWHSHHNESAAEALVLPIQDAGFHTWMRTLDIRFAR